MKKNGDFQITELKELTFSIVFSCTLVYLAMVSSCYLDASDWTLKFRFQILNFGSCRGIKIFLVILNPFSAGTAFMLMPTGWIQASRRVTRRLAWDPTCLPLSLSFPIKNKQNLKVLKSRRQYNLFLENYPAFKGFNTAVCLTWHIYSSGVISALLSHWKVGLSVWVGASMAFMVGMRMVRPHSIHRRRLSTDTAVFSFSCRYRDNLLFYH